MWTTTIGEALTNRGDALNIGVTIRQPGEDDGFIYVVRDERFVLYVGITQGHPINRLEGHCGLSFASGESRLGQAIRLNRPLSDTWHFDVLTVGEAFALLGPLAHPWDVYRLNSMESSMIRVLRPCLNEQGNFNGSPLPSCYRYTDSPNDSSARYLPV